MNVYPVPVGGMQNLTYVLEDEATSECLILDPSWDLHKVKEAISLKGMRPSKIVNTHHHFDHTTGNAELARYLKVPVVQHEESPLPHDVSVSDGGQVRFGGSSLRVYHTPGHSRDSICLVGDGRLFSGDTLFVGSCGRTDLEGGSSRELYRSLFGVLYNLDDSLEVLPGHDYGPSPSSTLGREKATNPVLQKRTEDEFVAMLR